MLLDSDSLKKATEKWHPTEGLILQSEKVSSVQIEPHDGQAMEK